MTGYSYATFGAYAAASGFSRQKSVGNESADKPIDVTLKHKTSYVHSSGKLETTADLIREVELKNGNYYTSKSTLDKIGKIEANGEDLTLLNRKSMSLRPSTEGGTSIVYRYSNSNGTKYLIHEVTNTEGYILHRDFDAVRIQSGQLINKNH